MDPDRARTRLRLRVLDARDRLRGRRVALVPPRHLEPGRHADFEFLVADVRDARRNPGAARREDDFRFPCADASVDVVSMSVTGLLPEACARHLGEAARVLAPDGSLAARFFDSTTRRAR